MRVVDLHNHFVAPEIVAFLEREGARYGTRIEERDGQRVFVIRDSAVRPLTAKISMPEPRLRDMDAAGVDVQAFSCVPFLMFPDVDSALARTIAAINNDGLAAVAARHPERFVGLCSVPLQDPPAAAKELERAAGLGFRGVEVPPRLPGLDFDDPKLGVFWEAAEALRMVVCIHPFDAKPEGAMCRYALGNLVGNLYDTGLAAALLVYGGVLEQHPGLRVVLYHAGGAFPSLVGRLDKGYEIFPEARRAIPRRPSSYLERFWFDILAFDRMTLHQLIARFGANRFVIGTDYPFPIGFDRPVDEVRALELAPADEAAILGGNAAELLRL
ncbi:MAG: amidohydrolase family protein [Candidatus Binatia bacterium]